MSKLAQQLSPEESTLAEYGGTLQGRDATGQTIAITTEPDDQDKVMGLQLSIQWDKIKGNRKEDLIFGAMMLKVRNHILTQHAESSVSKKGRFGTGSGLKSWLKENAPMVGEAIAYQLMDLAEGVQAECKLGKTVDLESILAAQVDELPEKLAADRAKVEAFIEGKSRRSIQLTLGLIEPAKPRGGDTSEKGKQLTPEEEQAKLEASLREDASAPFKGIEDMGDAWKILNDGDLEARILIAEEWTAQAREWLRTPKKNRPVLDLVKAVFKQQEA